MASTSKYPFDAEVALNINQARLDHLGSLGLSLDKKKVLEVGAGIGLLTHFFEERKCEIVSTEGRKELCEENLRRHPNRHNKVMCADLMVPGVHARYGQFDVVFCYGTLYHLHDPELCIRQLSEVCDGQLLLETVVANEDNGQINPVPEDGSLDQSLHRKGCRPGRDWVWNTLKEHFKYVYHTRTQPYHYEFPIEWPNQGWFVRTVFIASKTPLDLPLLSDELLDKQEKLQP